MAFKTIIQIECQESKDINTHLSVIRAQISYHLKNSELPITIEDETIYGKHTVKIEKNE